MKRLSSNKLYLQKLYLQGNRPHLAYGLVVCHPLGTKSKYTVNARLGGTGKHVSSVLFKKQDDNQYNNVPFSDISVSWWVGLPYMLICTFLVPFIVDSVLLCSPHPPPPPPQMSPSLSVRKEHYKMDYHLDPWNKKAGKIWCLELPSLPITYVLTLDTRSGAQFGEGPRKGYAKRQTKRPLPPQGPCL